MDEQNNNNINNQPVQNEPVQSVMRENASGQVVNPNAEQNDLADKTINAVENFMNTEDHKDEYTLQDKNVNKTNCILCYIPFVVFYFLITGRHKKSNYLFFHVNQGLNVTLCYCAAIIVSELLTKIFQRDGFVLNTVPGWVSFICYVLYCACFLLSLFGVINTVNDSSKELPLIGKIKLLK